MDTMTIVEFNNLDYEQKKKYSNLQKLSKNELTTLANDETLTYEIRNIVMNFLDGVPEDQKTVSNIFDNSVSSPQEYPALITVSTIYKLIGYISILAGLIVTAYMLLRTADYEYDENFLKYNFLPALKYAFIFFIGTVVSFAISEGIKLFINIADDVHDILRNQVTDMSK